MNEYAQVSAFVFFKKNRIRSVEEIIERIKTQMDDQNLLTILLG